MRGELDLIELGRRVLIHTEDLDPVVDQDVCEALWPFEYQICHICGRYGGH